MQAKLDESMEHQSDDDDEEAVVAEVVTEPVADSEEDGGILAKATTKPSSSLTKKKSPSRKQRKKSLPIASRNRSQLLMTDPVQPISDIEYENLEALMVQFCRVPLLAEPTPK
jgi:hypothetical protein